MKKNIRKRSISIVLSVVMLIAILCISPATVAAESTEDGLTYTVADAGITISGYTGEGGALIIPDEIDGKPVIAIGRIAFKNNANITSIVVPESVKSIAVGAFGFCSLLESITLPAECAISSTSNLFQNCVKLQSVQIPSGVTTIGNYMFSGCSALTSVTFAQPNTVLTTGMNAFDKCTSLEKIVLPDGLTTIGKSFSNNTSLKEITIPASVTAIDASLASTNPGNLTILCEPGSFAETYALEKGIPTAPIASPYEYILGDANGDGSVNIADVLKIQNWLSKMLELTDKELLAADIDANLAVEVADVLNIQKYKAMMAVAYPIGEKQSIYEEEIPDYNNPVIPTDPSDMTEPSEGTCEGTEPTVPEGQMTLYVSNAVSWITENGCKLWAYNVDTQEFVLMDINDDNSYFSAAVADTWQNIAFYRSTFDIDETTISTDLPIEQMPNKWTSLPARGGNDCFLVTADGAGEWRLYDELIHEEGVNTVYFDNSATQWDAVYIYGWSFGLANEFVVMEKVTDNIYKYTFAETPKPGVKGFLFVAQDSWTTDNFQTNDVATESGKNLYTNLSSSGGKWSGTWDVYEP